MEEYTLREILRIPALTTSQKLIVVKALDEARKPLPTFDLYMVLRRSGNLKKLGKTGKYITPREVSRFLQALEEKGFAVRTRNHQGHSRWEGTYELTCCVPYPACPRTFVAMSAKDD